MQRTVDEVFAAYGDRIFAAAFSVCRNRADADDVVQDTLVRYYTHPREFESEDHLKAWLLRVAINRARDVSTSFWRKHTVAWEEYMNDLAFEEPQDSHLFEAVMRLPAKYRAVLHLFYYEGYAVAEIWCSSACCWRWAYEEPGQRAAQGQGPAAGGRGQAAGGDPADHQRHRKRQVRPHPGPGDEAGPPAGGSGGGAVHPGGIAEARPPAEGAPLARMGKSKLGGKPP